jgi:ectoine hydroxylase-related dioxygenase (phytanoyl-CoA dioxygenase family)
VEAEEDVWVNDLGGDGYALADLVLTESQCAHIASSLPSIAGGQGGVRNLIGHPTVMSLLTHARIGRLLWSEIGRNLVAVKATLFDKTGEANWRVQWHQDRTIAVKERLEVSGYGPWSTKAGAVHVEAPDQVLAQMVALRIHLDDCGPENGPLRVIPGSHQHGKLKDDAIQELVAGGRMVELYVPQGSFLLMRPLLVHASSPARVPQHRRVLHLEFAPKEAISPLEWHETVSLNRAA